MNKPRRKLWPKERPPLPINPEHLQSKEEINAYLSMQRLKCLICGKAFGKLGAHVTRTHKLLVKEYNERFGLPLFTGLVGVSTKAKLRENVVKNEFNLYPAKTGYKPPKQSGQRRSRTATATLKALQALAKRRNRNKSRWSKGFSNV